MKLLPKTSTRPRHFRRFILTTTILPAALASSAFGANWNGALNLDTFSAPEDIHVQSTSIVTMQDTGGGLFILEPNIFFEATETLTVNGVGFKLQSSATSLSNRPAAAGHEVHHRS